MGDVLNIQSYDYFLEIYNETDITISSSVNQNGTIVADDKDNLLGHIVHPGSNYIYEATSTIPSNLIIYDDINFVYIDDDFDIDDIEKHFLIKPSHAVRYKINANRVITATASGSTITIDLSTSQPFHVQINGRVIDETMYTWSASGIVLNSPYENYITSINDSIVIYTFGNSQTVSGTMTLKYKSPQTLVPILASLTTDTSPNYTDTIVAVGTTLTLASPISSITTLSYGGGTPVVPSTVTLSDDGFTITDLPALGSGATYVITGVILDYFDTYTTNICDFESFDTSVDKSNNKINNLYQYMNFDEEVNRSSQANITLFKNISNADLRTVIQNEQFRILAYDSLNQDLTIFSNCIWNNGENKNYNRTKNDINYIINFEDEIEIDYQGAYTAYGTSTYGSGVYGGVNYLATNFRVGT